MSSLLDTTLGLLFGLVYGFVIWRARERTERLTWSWAGHKQWRSSLRSGIVGGTSVGLALWLLTIGPLALQEVTQYYSSPSSERWMTDLPSLLIDHLQYALFFALPGALLGALVVMFVKRDVIAQSIKPNEGITRSLRNGLTVLAMSVLLAVIVFGVFGILFGDLAESLSFGLGLGLVIAPIMAAFYGLGAALQHAALRVWLWRYHLAPLRYVRWLEEMVRARLLYRVGGGYEFVHVLLRDHLEQYGQK